MELHSTLKHTTTLKETTKPGRRSFREKVYRTIPNLLGLEGDLGFKVEATTPHF